MFVCICARVRESEIQIVIQDGARDEYDVGAACGAGTGCGSCLERICGMLGDEEPALARG